jgi:hypothetical protein
MVYSAPSVVALTAGMRTYNEYTPAEEPAGKAHCAVQFAALVRGFEYRNELPCALPEEVIVQQAEGVSVKLAELSSTMIPVGEAAGYAS